jgi:hypothetical protein
LADFTPSYMIMKRILRLPFFTSLLLAVALVGYGVAAMAQCTGMPNAGVPFGGPLSHTCSGNSNIDLGGATLGPGMVYQWEYSTDGTNWFPNGGPQTITTVSTGVITQTRMYRAISTCTNSGMSNTSSIITVTIIPGTQVTPVATITPSTGTTACIDDEITFTSTITNGGSGPAYQWQVNGSNVGTGSDVYIAPAGSLSTNDNVSLTVTSSNSCAVPQTALASVTMTILPLTAPAVNIQATETDICQGELVTFSAFDNAPGGTYQWYINGVAAGPNANSFTFAPTMGDVISLEFTPPSAGCYDNVTVNSNSIPMNVTPGLPTEANLVAQSSAPENSWVTVYANLFNFSLNYTIDWYINSNLFATTTVPFLTYQKGPGTDDIFAVANNAGTGCYNSDTSNTVSISSVPVSVGNVATNGAIYLYPNPANSSIRIMGLAKGDKLHIMNMMGQTLISKEIEHAGPEEQIDVNILPAGNYLLNVYSENGTVREIIRLTKN